MARQLLSQRLAAKARTGLRRPALRGPGSEWHIFFAAATVNVHELVQSDAARILFALKGERFITHMRKLREPLPPLANFFASGPLCLREKLGPILCQFPPQFHFNADRFRAFFDLCHMTRSRWLAWHESMMIGSKAASFLRQTSAGRFVTRSSFATTVFLTIVFFQCCAITGFHWW